ncbi:MAG: hypothetical protein R3298_13405, partial [Gammaproteobacteria bacterium]|nr:hypothetical protein [Gammaproteobacteria bacterium]
MQIELHNTLTRRKEAFTPLDPERVTMYVCGPTVYNLIHIGNARPIVVFDVLFRLLRSQYPEVVYARNITDVDDKINAAAHEQGIEIGVITKRFTEAYHTDMAALGVGRPTIEPRCITLRKPSRPSPVGRKPGGGFAWRGGACSRRRARSAGAAAPPL